MGSLSRTAVALVATSAAVLAGGGSALADPGAPATPEGVKQQVDVLYGQAEVAGQRYDGAVEQEHTLQRQVALIQQHIADEQQDVDTLTRNMGSLAAAEYRQGGGMDPLLDLMFSSDPEQYLQRATALQQADGSLAAVLQTVRDEERRLGEDRGVALSELNRLEQVRQVIAGSKAEAQHRLGRAQALLSTLSGSERDQLAQAEDSAAAAAAQAAGVALPDDQGPASNGAEIALAAARSAIGRPYVYGATGPGAFDCSGLMYWSWRHAGVALPRTSQGQAFAGRSIPFIQARPGDLVIFFGDRHHVGMYAGNGMVIHAPYPGARVRYERAADMPIAEVVRV